MPHQPRHAVSGHRAESGDQRSQSDAADAPLAQILKDFAAGHLLRRKIETVTREEPMAESETGVKNERRNRRDGDVAGEQRDGLIQPQEVRYRRRCEHLITPDRRNAAEETKTNGGSESHRIVGVLGKEIADDSGGRADGKNRAR